MPYDLAPLGHGRRRGRRRRPVGSRGRDLLGRPLSRSRRRQRTSAGPSSPTTTPTGTSTRCSGSRGLRRRRPRPRISTLDTRRGSRSARRGVARAEQAPPSRQPDHRAVCARVPTIARACRTLSSRTGWRPSGDAFEGRSRTRSRRRAVALDLLAEARQTLDRDPRRVRTVVHARGRDLGGRPVVLGGYVFPVGGGPQVVSVAHDHHDYPAADIAAPAGSPDYALANGDRRDVPGEDSRCGIGFTIRAFDGRLWTYCHMAFREPAVTVGASFTPASRSGSSARPATRPARTSISSSEAGDDYPQVRPGSRLRRQGVPLAGRADSDAVAPGRFSRSGSRLQRRRGFGSSRLLHPLRGSVDRFPCRWPLRWQFFAARLPRLAVIGGVLLFASATLTWAARAALKAPPAGDHGLRQADRGRARRDGTGVRVREGNAGGRRLRLARQRQGARLLHEHGRDTGTCSRDEADRHRRTARPGRSQPWQIPADRATRRSLAVPRNGGDAGQSAGAGRRDADRARGAREDGHTREA